MRIGSQQPIILAAAIRQRDQCKGSERSGLLLRTGFRLQGQLGRTRADSNRRETCEGGPHASFHGRDPPGIREEHREAKDNLE